MAITTYDQVIAGFQTPKATIKTGVTMAAVGSLRGYTTWYVNGNPGGASANSAGVNGQAVSGSVAGAIPRTNPGGGQNAYIGSVTINSSTSGVMWIVDRLWQNSGLSVTSTTLQSITPAAIPSRDVNGSNLGHQVMCGIEWSGAGGAGTPTVTLTYTDQDGNTGVTTSLSAVATPPIGTVEIFPLAAADTGIREITGIQQSATRTSGVMHLILFRVIAQIPVAANTGTSIDAFAMGLPRIYDNSVLQQIWIPGATTATTWTGTYIETHG